MRYLLELSVLLTIILTPYSHAHRGEDGEHEYLSDPARIDEALEHLELEDPLSDPGVCQDLVDCLIEKQENLGELTEQMTKVTEFIAKLTEDEELKRDNERLRQMLSECRDITTDREVSELVAKIENTHWIHGSEDCRDNTDPEMQVESMGMGLTIIRQNKCETAEAPFLYVLESEDKVMLIDTGDIYGDSLLYKQIREIAGDREIVVTHTHDHGDHTAGDGSFRGKENCTLHEAGIQSNKEMFGIDDWPNEIGSFDMGDRELQIIPVPGHEGSSIAIYDPKSKVMMTGDIVYPGRLYISDYPEFLSSLDRLKKFSEENEVAAYLGGHVEMSRNPGEDIDFGSYAPNERALNLRNSDLDQLYEAAYENSKARDYKVLDQFIIYP